MVNLKILVRAALVGAVLQIAFVLAMALVPELPRLVGLRTTMFTVMMISGVAGLLYAQDLDGGYSPGAFGGLVVGLVSSFIGFGLASVLGTPSAFHLGAGTVVGTGIGAIGGLFGQMYANLRRATRKL